ncbi:MAG: IS1096 element passenger TnpR family protein [Steroidobacteraceae bacterium]
MGAEQTVGAVQLSARLCGVSPPVTRRLLITEQASLAQFHAALQVAFGWSDEHLYCFQIRGWQFGDPARAIELALAGGGVDIPMAAFAFEINETFRYQYNLLVPWEIDCRIESRPLVSQTQPLACLAARGDPPDEELNSPAAYPEWLEESSPAWALHRIEELLEEGLNGAQLRAEVHDILANTRVAKPGRRSIDQRLRQLPAIDWDAGSMYEDADPSDH